MKINIDRNADTIPTNFSWQFGIGNDHAFQLLRKDVCEHIKLAHDELGIKYIRFHGIFDDDMIVLQRFSDRDGFNRLLNAEKVQELSFRRVANVYDNVLSCGMKPFVELSFMPTAIASGSKTGLKYNNNITMPKDLKLWADLIAKFIEFLLQRYGKREVESWYFEVWNEPDIRIFFDGSKEDYFKLYETTVKAIKGVDKNLKVGGPSTSACKWVKDFVDYCEENNLPYDFVSTHHYPGDGFVDIDSSKKNGDRMMNEYTRCVQNSVALGETITAMFFNPDLYKNWTKGIFAEMDKKARQEAGDKPLFITEWNSMATFAAPIHDEKYSAAFAVKSVMDVRDNADAYMFWCCSDVFEEMFDLGKPFHGSYGIVNNDGIPKPNFWAFKLLSQLYKNRLDLPTTNDEVEYSVFVDGSKTQILIYAQDFDPEKDAVHNVELSLNCIATGVTKQVIDNTHCNPKDEWLRLNKPDLLTCQQVLEIKEKTKLKKELQSFEVSNNHTSINLQLRTNDVVLLTIVTSDY
jgi:xylan 1,4-beta-xylosidase